MAMLATDYAERVPSDEEAELLSASGGESPKKYTPLRLGVVVIGVACLTVAAAAYVVTGWENASGMEAAPVNSARALLETPEEYYVNDDLKVTMKGDYVNDDLAEGEPDEQQDGEQQQGEPSEQQEGEPDEQQEGEPDEQQQGGEDKEGGEEHEDEDQASTDGDDGEDEDVKTALKKHPLYLKCIELVESVEQTHGFFDGPDSLAKIPHIAKDVSGHSVTLLGTKHKATFENAFAEKLKAAHAAEENVGADETCHFLLSYHGEQQDGEQQQGAPSEQQEGEPDEQQEGEPDEQHQGSEDKEGGKEQEDEDQASTDGDDGEEEDVKSALKKHPLYRKCIELVESVEQTHVFFDGPDSLAKIPHIAKDVSGHSVTLLGTKHKATFENAFAEKLKAAHAAKENVGAYETCRFLLSHHGEQQDGEQQQGVPSEQREGEPDEQQEGEPDEQQEGEPDEQEHQQGENEQQEGEPDKQQEGAPDEQQQQGESDQQEGGPDEQQQQGEPNQQEVELVLNTSASDADLSAIDKDKSSKATLSRRRSPPANPAIKWSWDLTHDTDPTGPRGGCQNWQPNKGDGKNPMAWAQTLTFVRFPAKSGWGSCFAISLSCYLDKSGKYLQAQVKWADVHGGTTVGPRVTSGCSKLTDPEWMQQSYVSCCF